MFRGLVVSLLIGTLALPAFAQKCDVSKPATAPSSQFKINDNGTVTDTNNTVWLRCGLGMSWNGSSCEGKTLTYSWAAAVEAVLGRRRTTVADHNDQQRANTQGARRDCNTEEPDHP